MGGVDLDVLSFTALFLQARAPGDYGAGVDRRRRHGNRLRQPAYNVVNSSVSWSSANELNKVTLWGNNLSNSQYTVALASQDTGDFAIYAPPRTFGIKYQRKF